MQIADQLGKPQSFISKYERGERRLDFTEFVELADVLGVDISDFVNDYRSATIQSTTKKVRGSKKPAVK